MYSYSKGFLCPSCLRAFPSADALQDHYETSHGSGLEVVCPTCRMRLGSEVELESHCARHHAAAPADTEPAAVEQLQRGGGDAEIPVTSELVLARQQLGSDLHQARMEASQLRTQLEQLLQSQPEVCRRDAQVQAFIAETTSPASTEASKENDNRAAALAALTAEKQTLQLKLEEADRRLAEARARADKARILGRHNKERPWRGVKLSGSGYYKRSVEAGRSERESLATSLEVAKQGLAAAATRAEELESELAVERQRGDSELQACQAEVDELRTQVTQLSAVEAALRDSAQAAQAQLADYRAQAENNAEQAARLAAQLRERESELATCREQLVTSQREAQASHEELVAGRAEKVELAQAVQALHQAKSRLADQLSALELEVGNLRNNQVALEADRTAFELEVENLRTSHAEMEASHAALETLVAELHRRSDQQAAEHQQAVQGLQAELARAQNKALQATSELEAEQQRSARQEAALEALREQLAAEQASRQTAQTQLDSAQGDKLELEAKLENALDERRALLDRCLRSEGEAETLRSNAADLRRRLDDSLAALHELGRENQLLQMDNAKHQGRKWADDSQVTHCTGCEKLFTVTIRKHHCRNCGNIFCNECSAKSAATASSRKPVRVCDNCYSELTK
ncbi:hypothetical protein HPB50_010605 [Hyalomma asiaticum]|uniref:Uncharacterized protein n=1 Tax=Hyalomma asiaticum TaxID=266040 RepID=A0ACB7S0L7_HYAAI|nr:hypothetical protein HPB50_010605 [Hyalomma asiaticum]